jgi:toxin ParE1/3/4
MSKIVYSPQARADLKEIWFYISEDNVEAADRFILRILEKCSLLAESPEMGRARDDIEDGVRSFPVGDYVILYRIDNSSIEIARVFHGKRDYQNLF